MNVIKAIATSQAASIGFIVAMTALSATLGTLLFGMRVSGSLGLYFITWWTVLFAVLPFGVRSQIEAGTVVEGTEPGAPALPRLREKALWTTVVASAVFLVTAAVLPLTGL